MFIGVVKLDCKVSQVLADLTGVYKHVLGAYVLILTVQSP